MTALFCFLFFLTRTHNPFISLGSLSLRPPHGPHTLCACVDAASALCILSGSEEPRGAGEKLQLILTGLLLCDQTTS